MVGARRCDVGTASSNEKSPLHLTQSLLHPQQAHVQASVIAYALGDIELSKVQAPRLASVQR